MTRGLLAFMIARASLCSEMELEMVGGLTNEFYLNTTRNKKSVLRGRYFFRCILHGVHSCFCSETKCFLMNLFRKDCEKYIAYLIMPIFSRQPSEVDEGSIDLLKYFELVTNQLPSIWTMLRSPQELCHILSDSSYTFLRFFR